jgi:CheY-like chemotaxis protein
VALTAHALKGDRERFLEAGIDGYVTKPIQVGDLLRAIDDAYQPRTQTRGAVEPLACARGL